MRIIEGKVVSVKMQGVVVVEVRRKISHPLYKKLINKRKKYKAAVGDMTVSLGDKVKIAETRPLSKDTHFRLLEVIKQ
ncbi:MAG: 30S ribosomal protein S17 [Candidatus Levybacteria bacterium]|nr:30S ribosomal protein S17 [Candidatus Levybacteria bacterium]